MNIIKINHTILLYGQVHKTIILISFVFHSILLSPLKG